MIEQTKAEQWWDATGRHQYGIGVSNCLIGAPHTLALAAFAAGQADSEASRPKAPTLLDIARRLRDEFPGVLVSFSPVVRAHAGGNVDINITLWTYETGSVEHCTSLDDAIARLRQARDGDANPADLPGADMEIDLAQPTD
jgi:hypothetical protein